MKYSIVAAALAGMAMAIPTNEWENVKDPKCPAVTKTYTEKECGNDASKWDNCKDVTKTKTEYPTDCPKKDDKKWCKGGKDQDNKECHSDDDDWSNWPNNCKWGKTKDGKDCKADDKKNDWENVPKKDDKKWCKGGKDQDNKECHSDDDDWSNWPNNCKWGKTKDGKDCKADDKKNDWENMSKKPEDDKKCYSTKVYTTKECGNDKDKWDNCKDVTKTKTEYATTCTEWVPVTPTAVWTTWADVKKCDATTKTYTTKECGNDKDKWDNCKDVTKTKTEYPTECATKKSETWSVWTTEAPKVPAVTSSAEWNTWKASSTVAAPVAKWTGAADKQTFGYGALAIAAVAALL